MIDRGIYDDYSYDMRHIIAILSIIFFIFASNAEYKFIFTDTQGRTFEPLSSYPVMKLIDYNKRFLRLLNEQTGYAHVFHADGNQRRSCSDDIPFMLFDENQITQIYLVEYETIGWAESPSYIIVDGNRQSIYWFIGLGHCGNITIYGHRPFEQLPDGCRFEIHRRGMCGFYSCSNIGCIWNL